MPKPEEDAEDTRTAEEIAAENAAAYVDFDMANRLWLKVLIDVIRTRTLAEEPDPRVQKSYDDMHMAVCERVQRIVESDLPRGVRTDAG